MPHIPPDFLRNKNAALPVRAQKSPLTRSGLKKHGSQMAPAATHFRAPSECRGYGVRDDVGYEYTCFMRGGEDARLHGRFSGKAPALEIGKA
jgi:hypothetical protein